MTSTKRALALTFATQNLSTLIFFATTVIVSRLLTPEEIGIYSIALAFVAFGHLLRDFGSGQYVIQEPDLTTDRIRAALTVTFLLGWSVALVTYVSAPYIGEFYRAEGVTGVLRLLALNFFLVPFGSVTMACFQRDMNFKPSAVAKTISTLAQSAVSIALAYLGYSFIGLAWGNIAGTLAFIAVAMYYRPRDFPRMPSFRNLGRVLSFGGKMSLDSILNQIGTATPELIVGRMLGMAPVGLMSRGQGVVSIFSTLVLAGVHPVVMPLFAKIKREQGSLKSAYIRGTSLLAVIGWTFFGCLIVLAPELIVTLFGERWIRASFLVQVFAVGHINFMFFALSQQLFVATGKLGEMIRARATTLPIYIALVAVGATHSLELVALLSLIMAPISFVVFWRKIGPILEISAAEFVRNLLPTGQVALISSMSVLVTKQLIIAYISQNSLLVLSSCFLVGSLVWCLLVFKFKHPIAEEISAAYRSFREHRT